MSTAPLTYEASLPSTSNSTRVATLPHDVVTCLDNARFLHLATCDAQIPHVSLMNYTYLPSTPFSNSPTIVMTTNPSSKKTLNLQANPRVSLLVHDWVSHRPPTRAPDSGRDGSPSGQPRSSLADLLFKMNTSALSRISATINGEARFLETGSEEERWCKEMHLKNNTFGEDEQNGTDLFGTSPGITRGDGGRGYFIEDEEVLVVLVNIRDGRIADWKGSVQDWTLAPAAGESEAGTTNLTNGV